MYQVIVTTAAGDYVSDDKCRECELPSVLRMATMACRGNVGWRYTVIVLA